MKKTIKWEHLLPKEFRERQAEKSLVYLPMGICEPHGHIAPFGLDTIKAEYLCETAAERFGGIVAPTLGYQIHEAGYHARWLEDVVGEVNPHMTAMPPKIMLKFFLYQLRSFANAGFQNVFALTGHAGGNQDDFRLVAAEFEKETGVKVIVKADPELVEGRHQGDHAGKYEISQLLYLHPELMDMDRINEIQNELGRFAQGEDANEATAALGKQIMEDCLLGIKKLIDLLPSKSDKEKLKIITYEQTEAIWEKILEQKRNWKTLKPAKYQKAVSKSSQWKPFENIK